MSRREATSTRIFIIAVWLVSILAILTTLATAGELPPPGAWTEQGVVLRPSVSGWDSFTHDAFGVSCGVKKDGVYYLYYVGASGPRYDGGAANRALGVATSPNGINFTKYSGNPIITHQPSEGHENQVEEGIISSAVALDDDGNFVLYWGALTAVSSTEVKCDIHMSVSSDGFNFVDQGIVVPNTIDGGGNEVWPNGVLHTGGKWYLWYATDGFRDEFGRKTSLVSGNTPGVLDEPFTNPIHSGALGSSFLHSDGDVSMIVQQCYRWPTCDIVVEKTTIDTRDTYTSPITYFSADDTDKIFGGFVIPDFENEVLYWYYVGGTWNDEADRLDDLRACVRTAPITDTISPTTTSVITPAPNEAGWNNATQVVVTFFRADNGSGISYTNYSKTSEMGPWTAVGISAATGPDAGNVSDIIEGNFNVTVLKEWTTEIWYYSVDNNSNIETTKNVTVKIDTTSPIMTIHSPENKTYITKIIPLNFTANEPLDTCFLSVDSTTKQTNCKNQAVISREYEAREGTVAWWHFNCDANDTSGNNNHGTITGASFVDGKFGSALQFDGINDWVSISDSDNFDTINKTITIEAWIKPVLTGNRNTIFYKESCFGFEITERGNVSFVLCDTNGSCQRFDSNGIVKNNTWNHIAGTSDGTTMRIYINGEQDPITNQAPAIIYTSNYSASIGIWQYGESGFDYPFNGDIEELRIQNRCLSEEQIKSDYALGEGTHSVTVYGRDTAGNWNSSTAYFNITGSYPQMIHAHTANVTAGTITCEEFVDANGKSYDERILAIKLKKDENERLTNI